MIRVATDSSFILSSSIFTMRRMAPHEKPRRGEPKKSKKRSRRTPTDRVRLMSRDGMEHVLMKVPGKLIDVSDSSARQDATGVSLDHSKISKVLKATGRRTYSSLHNHPITLEELRKRPSIPSDSDFRDFMKHAGERTMIIAQADPRTGEVAGYYFFRKTASTPEMPERPKDSNYAIHSSDSEVRKKAWEDLKKARRAYWDDPTQKMISDSIYNYHRNTVFRKRKQGRKLVVRKRQSPKLNQAELDRVVKDLRMQQRYVPTPGHVYKPGIGFLKK